MPRSPTDAPPRFRRILFALDSAAEDFSAVDFVFALAARLQAELSSLFVEDIDVVRLAEHPDVSTFSTVLATHQPLSPDHLKRALRMQLVRSRQAIEQAAMRQRMKATFEVRQGRLSAEILAAAGDVDLVVVSWSERRSVVSRFATPTREAARRFLETAPLPVLLVRPGAPPGGPVLVVYDGTDAAREALAAATDLADRNGAGIEVALLTGRLHETVAWEQEIRTAFGGTGLRLSCVQMPKASVEDLCSWARQRAAAAMVLAGGHALLEGDGLRRLLDGTGCSILLLR